LPAPVEPALVCGNCRQPMQRLTLAGHYGHRVDLDLCRGCDLVWFDGSETAQLSGPALLELIGHMAAARALPHEMLRADPRCPRCDGSLKLVRNQSRWGRSSQLQCARRHGAYQSFAQFLEEKGLVRPMSTIDRAKLLRDRGRIECVNCGGEIAKERRALSLVPLDPEPSRHRPSAPAPSTRSTRSSRPPSIRPRRVRAPCTARRAARRCPRARRSAARNAARRSRSRAWPTPTPRCRRSRRCCARRPSGRRPKVVKRRLAALAEDLPRRREWVAGMEADAPSAPVATGAGAWGGSGRANFDWSSLLSSGTNPVRAVLIALALWFAWYFWH
jgi:hypothetical protein